MKKVIVFDVDGVILHHGCLDEEVFSFIRDNYKKYDFFTNTTFLKRKLIQIFSDLDIGKYFMELLAYDNGDKQENIEYIKKVYNVLPENILFIDDRKFHINSVQSTGVHTLLFEQDGVSLQEKIDSIF